MLSWINYVLVYAGVAVMVYNIYGFIRYARYVQGQKAWRTSSTILYVPIALVILFLLGYLAVGLFGQPDLVIACILFGGSIFVAFMHQYLSSITHRIMENERLEAELMAAEKSNEAKASFLASMNHEMHTPLNVIMGMNDLALKNPALPPEVAEQLEKSNLSAKHLLGLIDNALDLNRIEAGMLAIANEEFSLADALAQVNAIAHASCAAKGLTYEPNAVQRKHCRVTGDETNLKRVLLSILDNAVKYTDAPGNVTFAAERVPAEDGTFLARFVVSDTGIGMDEEFIPRVFQAFSQEDAGPTTQYGGSGMSLAVAKSLIELMGGTIEVKSSKGQGTTFTVTVPFACVAEHDAPAEQPGADPAEALSGARILIVEDTPENAEIVADLLELEGAETEHAENGQVALDMVAASPERYYDAILMDLRMPVMGGLEAARRIRALERADAKTVPIVALTANALEEDRKSSLEAGMDAHLAKPTDSDLLYRTLGTFIARARGEHEARASHQEERDPSIERN